MTSMRLKKKRRKKKKKIWGGAYCYYLNILHLGVILLWSEKYFGMVTLLLCKAVLGKEALPLGAAYYFKVQNTGLDHNMLLWITLQCFDKLDCLLGGSKALELDGREWFNRHKYLQWSTAEWINFEQSWITVELTSKTVLKCCRVVIEMFYKVTEVLQKCIKW